MNNKPSCKIIWAILLLAFFVQDNFLIAQPAKYSNAFMDIGVGARNLGLGNATIASVSDLSAGYWNPSGLVNLEQTAQVGFMHSEYFAGIAKYDWLGAAFSLDSGKNAFGINAIRFAVDDIPNTINLIGPDGSINYDNIRSFSVGDYGFMFSYARRISNNLSVGGTAKIVYHKAGSFAKAYGFGIDVGAQYKLKDFKFGVNIRDITTTFNAWNFSFTDEERTNLLLAENEIPDNSLEVTMPKILLGAGYYKRFNKFELNAELAIDITTDGKRNVLVPAKPLSFDPHLGVEIGFADIVYVRGGVSNIQKELKSNNIDKKVTAQPNIGVGLRFKTIAVDYAFTDVGSKETSTFSHVISARIGFNKKSK
ncbi:MAG: PorV/PorQ family protein [Chitinophagales bacterium]|nr:PorV/PorQ family protein [Chitinophagales bacterium]